VLRPYVSAQQLAELTPWTPDAIEKMVRRGVLRRGMHYFQPGGRRTQLIFKWSAIEDLIEGRVIPGQTTSVLEDAPRRVVRELDVEKATKELQSLLC